MKRLRDLDTANLAQNLRAAGWSAFGALLFGIAGAHRFGPAGFIIGWLAGAVLIWIISVSVAGQAAKAGATVYFGSGSSTPGKREYSLGDALVARGQLREAADEYERCAVLYPEDPEPRLRLARLYRDGLALNEDAAQWFRRVLAVGHLEANLEIAAMRELIELFTHRLHDPPRALPVLARLVEKHGHTPAGAWAREQMREIKREMPR